MRQFSAIERGLKPATTYLIRGVPYPVSGIHGVDLAAKEISMKRLFTGIGLSILLLVPAVAGAQILVAGEGPVVYGHHHLNTTNMDAQKKFFVDTLGGKLMKFGTGDRQQEIIKFPNVLIFFRPMQAPTGGSIGTTVNHIGFSAPD